MAEWMKAVGKSFHLTEGKWTMFNNQSGEVAEWFKAHAWNACWVKALAGSNPVFSALVGKRILGKDVYAKAYRGFESPSLRKF